MNIQQLKLFSDVVRFGSVNKAAQANYTSPSTLSRSIRELEKRTRIVLFRRGRDGMQLTHQGEEFYMMVQPILNDLQQLERSMQMKTASGSAAADYVCTAEQHCHGVPDRVL